MKNKKTILIVLAIIILAVILFPLLLKPVFAVLASIKWLIIIGGAIALFFWIKGAKKSKKLK